VDPTPLQAIHNRPHKSLASKNYDVIETNNNQKSKFVQLLSQDGLVAFPLDAGSDTDEKPFKASSTS
jgi:hypothetical protein